MSKTPAAKKSANRRNVYFKNPHIYDALQMAVEKGIIEAKSASGRLEELIATEVRRLAPKLRRAGVTIPSEVFDK